MPNHFAKTSSHLFPKKQKHYIITTPKGEEVQVCNLKAFCLQYNLSDGSMIAVAQGKRKHYKGFKIRYA